jgi:hypothetical protein
MNVAKINDALELMMITTNKATARTLTALVFIVTSA